MNHVLRRCALALVAALALTSGVAITPATASDWPGYGTITGTVRGPDGRPVEDLLVVAMEEGTGEFWTGEDDGTDATGRYEVYVRAGRYDLRTDDQQERFAKTDVLGVTVRDGATTTRDLTVEQALTLTGRVARTDGGPVTGVEVQASAVDSRTTHRHYGVVAADGTYTVRGLHRGTWRVTADPFGATAAELMGQDLDGTVNVHRDGGTPVVVDAHRVLPAITLRHRTPVVTGVVRGVGGRPVAGLTVHTVDANWESDHEEGTPYPGIYGTTDAAGRYTLRVAEPGRAWRFAVDADAGYAGTPFRATVPAVGGTRTADVRVRSAATVSTRVASTSKRSTVRVVYRPEVAGANRVAKVTVRYTATNGRARTVRGTLSRSGAVTVRLVKPRRGTRSITVHVAGNADTAAVTRTVKARIR